MADDDTTPSGDETDSRLPRLPALDPADHPLADTRARRIALDCLAAGVAAARPERVVAETVAVADGRLTVTGANVASRQESDTNVADKRVTLALDDYERLLLVGGGKAAAGLTRALVTRLREAGYEPDGGTVLVPPSAVSDDSAGSQSATTAGAADQSAKTAGAADQSATMAGAADQPVTPVGAVDLVAGGHPTPTAAGVAATREALANLDEVGAETLVLAPITGGGSALLAAPVAGVSVESLQRLTRELLDRGASVHELNTVRAAVSAVKGGGLARHAAPATVVGLVVSDVVGDDPRVIASGPTVPRDRDPAAAVAVLDRYGVDVPEVRGVLDEQTRDVPNGDEQTRDVPNGDEHADCSSSPTADTDTATSTENETPTTSSHTLVVASSERALAAAAAARSRGCDPYQLSRRVTGEARDCGQRAGALAATIADCRSPTERRESGVSGQSSPDVDRGAADADRLSSDTNRSHPIVCLSAGETTVTVTGDGTGGPNCEYVLAAGRELARRDCSREVAVGAVDTDGLDGSTDAAGGLLDGATVANADPASSASASAGPASSASANAGPTSSSDAATTGTGRVEAALADNDALPLLRELDAALEPGPTGTNVDDLRVLVVTRS